MSTASVSRWRDVASHGSVQELAMVMFLPHLLGIVSLLAATGSLDSPAGIAQLGVLVLNGPASFSIVLCRMDTSRVNVGPVVAGFGVLLVPATAVAAGLTPTLAVVVPEAISTTVGGLIVATLAVSIGTEWYDDVGPSVKTVAALLVVGLIVVAAARVLTGGADPTLVFDRRLFLRGGAAGAVGVLVVAVPLFARDRLRRRIDMRRLRFGFACALSLLALELLQVVQGFPSLYLTGCTVLLATERGSSIE